MSKIPKLVTKYLWIYEEGWTYRQIQEHPSINIYHIFGKYGSKNKIINPVNNPWIRTAITSLVIKLTYAQYIDLILNRYEIAQLRTIMDKKEYPWNRLYYVDKEDNIYCPFNIKREEWVVTEKDHEK